MVDHAGGAVLEKQNGQSERLARTMIDCQLGTAAQESLAAHMRWNYWDYSVVLEQDTTVVDLTLNMPAERWFPVAFASTTFVEKRVDT